MKGYLKALFVVAVCVLIVKASAEVDDYSKSDETLRYQTVVNKEFFDLTHSEHSDGYLVFFGASWCGHCKVFKPTFGQLAEKSASGKLSTIRPKFIMYPVEDNDELSAVFAISSFPTILYIKDNRWCKLTKQRSEENIKSLIESPMTTDNCQDYRSTYPGFYDKVVYFFEIGMD